MQCSTFIRHTRVCVLPDVFYRIVQLLSLLILQLSANFEPFNFSAIYHYSINSKLKRIALNVPVFLCTHFMINWFHCVQKVVYEETLTLCTVAKQGNERALDDVLSQNFVFFPFVLYLFFICILPLIHSAFRAKRNKNRKRLLKS